jgi:primosomal protein N' (replication factor Y)
VGERVFVPFGSRLISGVVYEVAQPGGEGYAGKIKTIAARPGDMPCLPATSLDLCRFVAEYYQHPLGEVLPHALPVLVRKGEPAAYRELEFWFATEAGMAIDLNELKRAAKQQQALALLRKGPQTPSALKQEEIQSAAHNRKKPWKSLPPAPTNAAFSRAGSSAA